MAQALGVLDEAGAALELDAPHVALAAQARGEAVGAAAARNGRRRGRGRRRRRRADHLLDALEPPAHHRHADRGRALPRADEERPRRRGVPRSVAPGEDLGLVEVEQRERRAEREPLRRRPRGRHVLAATSQSARAAAHSAR